MTDEQKLNEKPGVNGTVCGGATTTGEHAVTGLGMQRAQSALGETDGDDEVEWQFSLTPWSHQLLVALAKRYQLKPYRYKRQRETTLVIRASERFLKTRFLPRYDQLVEMVYNHFDEVTRRVVADVLDGDIGDILVGGSRPQQLEILPVTNDRSKG